MLRWLVVMLAVAQLGTAQTPGAAPKMEFDVASVKINNSGTGVDHATHVRSARFDIARFGAEVFRPSPLSNPRWAKMALRRRT